jgi:NTE family protein
MDNISTVPSLSTCASTRPTKTGLALSGGGYRAAAFHLGTLSKLHELNVLNKVDVLSTISGGSITGAAWCLYAGDYDSFHKEMVTKLTTQSVIHWVLTSWTFIKAALFIILFLFGALTLTFTTWAPATFPVLILFFFLLFRYQFKIFPVSQEIEKAYNAFFYQGKTLKDLPSKPLLAIGSSNLHSGRPFTFSKAKMSDSSYVFRSEYNPPIHFKQENFPVARAVMASSCVPFAFTPVIIGKEFFRTETDYSRIKPILIDGGVYDNQGIQKLTQPNSSYECDQVITSDAGSNFIMDKKYPNAIALLIRTVDLFMYRIKAVQMVQNIYRNVGGRGKPIAYFSLGWRIQNAIPGFVRSLCNGQILPEVIAAHGLRQEWADNPGAHIQEIENYLKERLKYEALEKRDLTEEQWRLASSTGTNLTCLSTARVEYLIRHAQNLTEIQIKLYCPDLLKES